MEKIKGRQRETKTQRKWLTEAETSEENTVKLKRGSKVPE